MNCEFGNFQETYDWIECKSIQFPGKIYFFNLRTRSSTWFRPVPRDVQLQHYDKKTKTYTNNFASDIDNSIILSSEDEKRGDNYMNKKKVINKKHVITRKVKKKMYKKGTCENSEIFMRSPYELRPTTAINYCDNNEYFDNMNCISKDRHIKNNYSKLQDFCFQEKEIYNHFDKSIALNSHKSSILKNKMIVTKKNEQFLNKSSSNDKFISILNVQNTTSSCMLKEKSQKNQNAKEHKETQLKESKLESSKIIGEMYGKVINYDSVKSKLPPGVKITKLSDSSTTLSSWHDNNKNVQLAIPNNFEIPNANLHINLSESDSSSTSCSCSSCSTSSDTNSTSTSDIYSVFRFPYSSDASKNHGRFAAWHMADVTSTQPVQPRLLSALPLTNHYDQSVTTIGSSRNYDKELSFLSLKSKG